MKTLKTKIDEVAQPLSKGEQNFKALHGPVAANRNLVPGITDQDFLFKGTERKLDPSTASYEGDESTGAYDKTLKVEEEVELEEKHLTPAEMKKREEIVKALKRRGMGPEKAFPIATATAKKVAEELKGNQHKIDANKNNKIDAEDFKLLKKKKVAEELKGNQHRIDANKNNKIDAGDFKLLKKKKEAMKEDVEMDYEGQMAKAELNAIADKAATIADMLDHNTQMEAWLQSKISRAKDYVDAVHDYMMYSDKDEPASEPEEYTQSNAMSSNYGQFINRMGEETELDEARRGRPSKNATGDEEGGREHIVVQLRKVVNLRGARPVDFNDNSKKDISVEHAKKALEMHSSMKPIQKGEFEARLAKSHSSFHSAIKGEPPEKAKPKISLGSMRRESVDQVDEARGTIKASDKRDRIAVTTSNPKTGRPEVKYMTLPKKDIKVTEATDKVNMQQDSINRLVKMSPLAAKMKVKLPPTQGNKPIGGEEQVHANMAEETLNRLYESLSNSNKVKFMEKFNTENGIDSLLHFAQEQGF